MKYANILLLIKKTSNYLNGYRLRLSLSIFLNMMDIALDLIQPLIWGYFIADICQLNFSKVSDYIVAIIAIYVIQVSIIYGKEYNLVFISENIEKNMRMDLYNNIINYPILKLDNMGEGDVLSRMEGDVMSIASIYTDQLFKIATNVIKVVLICIVVANVNILLAGIVFLFFPITYLTMLMFGKRINREDSKLRDNVDHYYTFVQNTISSIRDIKTLGLKEVHRDQFSKRIERNKELQIKLNQLNILQNNAVMIIDFFAQITVYVVGINLIINETLSVEHFIAMAAYTVMMSSALIQVAGINPELQEASVSLERIQKILDEMESERETFGKVIINGISSIEYYDVCFSYNNHNEGINNINLKIEKPGKYIIAGPNGSGKTTLMALLLRLYTPDRGSIKINGININEIDEQSLVHNITVISHDSRLFNMSILENLVLDGDCNLEQVKKVCKSIGIGDFIESLPKGYDTPVEKFGEELSTGQRGKIVIARALIRNSSVIILDEAMASLDKKAKEQTNNIINKLKRDHIVFEINHGTTDKKDADMVIMLNEGTVDTVY